MTNPEELAHIGTEIVTQANERGAVLRLFGGVGVYVRCPSIASHARLKREYADIDFVAPQSAWKVIPDLFISRGFRMQVNSPERATFTRGELTADVRGAVYRDYFSFDLATRLTTDPLTLPLCDLLLLKLSRVKMQEKDIQDATALLLDHAVRSAGGADEIDRDAIVRRTNTNWGLWTTVFDNTVMLEKVMDRFVEGEEAQRAWRRIELIQEVMDGRRKSLGWWLRAIPNRRIKWYREPKQDKPAEPAGIPARMTK